MRIKGDPDGSRPDGDPDDPELAAQIAHGGNTPECHELRGRSPETVDDLIHEVLPFLIFHPCQTAVDFKFVPGIIDIIIRNIGIELDIDDRIRYLFFRFAPILERTDRLLQQTAVQGKPHTGNLAVLFRAQQIAGTADLQIAHGDLEPGAQFRKVPDGLQSFLGNFRQDAVLLVEKIGVGQTGRPAHTAPHLIQL